MTTSNSPIAFARKKNPAPVLQSTKRAEAARVIRELEELCSTLGPGDRLPRHTELMSRFGASERYVLRALDEMQRYGRVVRRHGSGTFVTDPANHTAASAASFPLVSHHTIVALTRPDHSSFDRCVELLYDEAAEANLEFICRFIGADRDNRFSPASLGHPLGVIVFGREMVPLAQQLLAFGNRVVIMGSPLVNQILDVPCVYGNHEQGGYLATKHLIDLGHRSLAYLDTNQQLQEHSRWRGHLKAIREAERAGLTIRYEFILQEREAAWRDRPETAAAFLRRDPLTLADMPPTAIVAWNDQQAIELSATLRRAGVCVPEEVSLVGYDNLVSGERLLPSLTSVDHGLAQQVAAAVGLLTGDAPPPLNTQIIFSSTLVPRESTAPPRSVVSPVLV